MKSHGCGVRVLAVIPERMEAELRRQLAPLRMTICCAERAVDVAHLISKGELFEVALLPETSSGAEWWALWGELCLISPRPEILVYARSNSFQLWTGVLDMGGMDVIVHPFSDREIQLAVRRAIRCFEARTGKRSL